MSGRCWEQHTHGKCSKGWPHLARLAIRKVCLVPGLWPSGNSHQEHGSLVPRAGLHLLSPADTAERIKRCHWPHLLFRPILHLVCVNPNSLGYIPSVTLPSTNLLNILFIPRRGQSLAKNDLHQSESLGDLNISKGNLARSTSTAFHLMVILTSSPLKPSFWLPHPA